VPLCNLPADALRAAADVAFARALHAGNHLLWAEDPKLPDIAPAKQRWDDDLNIAADPVEINNPCASPQQARCTAAPFLQPLFSVGHICMHAFSCACNNSPTNFPEVSCGATAAECAGAATDVSVSS
jgi:hypothetical protein